MKYAHVLFILNLVIIWSTQATAQEFNLPEDRRIIWSPGMPGGIPTITEPSVNVLTFGADSSGNTDCLPAFKNAINSLPPTGGIIFIPGGKYLLKETLSIDRDNIVLVGEGKSTRLLSDAPGNSVEIEHHISGNWQPLSANINKATQRIVVADASMFQSGSFLEIEQNNDPQRMYTDPVWKQSWAENSVGQMIRIDTIIHDTILLIQPVNIDFETRLEAKIRSIELVQYVGFENFYIEKINPKGHTFSFFNSAYCWIRNIESYHTRRSHVNMSTSLGNVVRDSYFHHSFHYGGGGSGYGVELGEHVTSVLVENNHFDSLRHAMMVQVGANGNVFAYNYSTNPVQGDGETNLNQGWIPPDISIHGHYPFMNLFEGNEVEEIGIGDYWGPAGPGNTYFRNRVKGDGIIYYDASHSQNVVGNVTTGIHDESGKARNKIEYANSIIPEDTVEEEYETHPLPDSYYLHAKPSFFEDLPWPPF